MRFLSYILKINLKSFRNLALKQQTFDGVQWFFWVSNTCFYTQLTPKKVTLATTQAFLFKLSRGQTLNGYEFGPLLSPLGPVSYTLQECQRYLRVLNVRTLSTRFSTLHANQNSRTTLYLVRKANAICRGHRVGNPHPSLQWCRSLQAGSYGMGSETKRYSSLRLHTRDPVKKQGYRWVSRPYSRSLGWF